MSKIVCLFVLNFLLLFSVSLAFIGCTGNTIYKKPDNLISKNKMTDIMVDLYLANVAYNIPNKSGQRNLNYTALVFQKYGIDSLQYAQSNLYYMSKIDEYEKMHRHALEIIEKQKNELTNAVKKSDSLKQRE